MKWSLPSSNSESTCLGRVGPFSRMPYNIPVDERSTHMYVIGITGQGKSKFLESLLVSDIIAGRGCGLVDPHTDLARDTLTNLASTGYFSDPSNFERVIYFDPTRTDFIIPFNVLKSPLPPYTIAQQVIESFKRTWPKELEAAPRFTNISLVTLLLLIEMGLSLVEMPQVLTDKDYRDHLLSRSNNPQVVKYFHDHFDKWGRDTASFIDSVLNKVFAFTFNPYIKNLLGANENRLDFRKIMDEGKVLIVDLGHCDPETRRLVGSLVVTGMELAALSRKDTRNNRTPFYLFLDEFQDFCANDGAAKTLSQILSECRKFGLHLHLAHQTLGQIHERVSSALGNVGIKVVFSIDREDAEVMARKLFSVDTTEVKDSAKTDTQHHLYSPLPEQWEKGVRTIQDLAPRTALVKRRGTSLAQITTETIKPYNVDGEYIDTLMKQLAQTHGVLLDGLNKEPHSHSQEPVQFTNWDSSPA